MRQSARRAALRAMVLVGLAGLGSATVWSQAAAAQQAQPRMDALRQGFMTPPDAAKARCYWWWLNGHVTKDGITRDLEGMKAKGIAGAILVDADGSGEEGNREVKLGPAMGSPAWMELFAHALAEAQRLGLEISLNVTSRWNVGIIGDHHVKPEDALKLMTWTRTVVKGGGLRTLDVPAPRVVEGYYEPIAVLAYPLHHGAAIAGQPGSGRKANPDLRYKSAAAETGFSMPLAAEVLRDGTAVAGEQDADQHEVVDLSAKMNADGKLTWEFPEGTWEVLRLGVTNSGKKLLEQQKTPRGLPVDVLDRGALDRYWQQTVEPMLKVAKPYIGSSLRYLVTDSWESGGANWTHDFRDQFKKRRGYDPVPFLPVVTGRLLTSREVSNQFLFDVRRTVADLITENYYDHFAELAKANGLGTHPESGGPHGAPIDALETFRSASFPQTEFWADSGWHRVREEERYFVKQASSAAHVYGKTWVAAEGPTSMNRQAWSEALATNVQPAIDHAFTEGLNHIFWHEFTSSPVEEGKPGQEYFAGTHLNPNVTWWGQAQALVGGVNRAQFLLQQGRPVSDVLYFYGNQVPNFVRPKNDDPAHVGQGYDYDVADEYALLTRITRDGAGLKTAEGVHYRVLALPASETLSLEAVRWVERYVAEGGVAVGLKPTGALGQLTEEQAAEYRKITAELWAHCDAKTGAGSVAYGKGTLYCTAETRDALAGMSVAKDFAYAVRSGSGVAQTGADFDFIHRSTDEAEIYFVRNTQSIKMEAKLYFRAPGMVPELWSYEDGAAARAAVYRATEDGRIEIPLSFQPDGSVFVVLRKGKDENHAVRVERDGAEVYPAVRAGVGLFANVDGRLVATEAGLYRVTNAQGKTINQPVSAEDLKTNQAADWKLKFPAGWGAPAEVKLEKFASWTESKQPGVRYFSGAAKYESTLQWKQDEAGRPVWLDLGSVREIATVRVNGKEAGTVWRAPYAVRVDSLLQQGANLIEVEVANLWPNRLIGDQQDPNAKHYTETNISAYEKDSPLLPSGILEPVQLKQGVVLDWNK